MTLTDPAGETPEGAVADTAKRRFKARTLEWAAKLNVDVRSIAVRPLTTKWASCSTTGRLTFDSRVPELPSELQDYVIVHELLHFSVPNHGRLWKSLMRTHLGSYEYWEERLREIAGR
jgi:hypothetical protein